MSERVRHVGWRLALVVVLAVAGALNLDAAGLQLADPDDGAANGVAAALDALPDGALVLVGFDPDLGTYGEVRSTVRTLLADVLQRGARLAFISFTPEGRALALAEMARIGAPEPVDLGFVPGAEAALVTLARALDAGRPVTAPAGEVSLDGLALAVIVGGNDIGPRSWVEQVATRAELPLVAVTPSVLLPDVEPYRESGQLDALISTPRQGATYRAAVDPGATLGDTSGPAPAAVLVGLLVAVGYLGVRGAERLGATRGRDRA